MDGRARSIAGTRRAACQRRVRSAEVWAPASVPCTLREPRNGDDVGLRGAFATASRMVEGARARAQALADSLQLPRLKSLFQFLLDTVLPADALRAVSPEAT